MTSGIASVDSLTRAQEHMIRKEEEVHQQIMSLSDLRSRRNSFLPVFRLPPETLAIIFIHAARDYYESGNGGRSASRIPTWVNVSYVCSHWRNVALGCSSLWTYHFNLSPSWTDELLRRSKQASLKIRIYPSQRRFGEVFWCHSSLLHDLLKHVERIQELRLDVPLSFIPDKLSFCAPRLETLEIQLREHSKGYLAITDADTPVLRTLKLSRCLLPWSSLNLSKLQTLSICNTTFPSPLHLLDFFAVLGCMQDLTVLHLMRSLPRYGDPFASDSHGIIPKINFPRLDLLVVVAPVSAVIALLCRVDFPLKAQLSLGLEYEPRLSSSDISSLLAQRFSLDRQLSSSVPTFRSLIIEAISTHTTLTCSSSKRDCRLPSPLEEELEPHVPLQIGLRAFLSSYNENDLVAEICRALPFANVQTLYVRSPESSSHFWKEVLGSLDGLRFLKLSDGRMPDLSALALPAQESEGESNEKPTDAQDGRVLVPALEELKLVDIDFIPDDAGEEGRDGGMSKKSLLDVLATRKSLGDVRLTMVQCGVWSNAWSVAGELVP